MADGKNETKGTEQNCLIKCTKNVRLQLMTKFDKKVRQFCSVPFVSKGEINAEFKSNL